MLSSTAKVCAFPRGRHQKNMLAQFSTDYPPRCPTPAAEHHTSVARRSLLLFIPTTHTGGRLWSDLMLRAQKCMLHPLSMRIEADAQRELRCLDAGCCRTLMPCSLCANTCARVSAAALHLGLSCHACSGSDMTMREAGLAACMRERLTRQSNTGLHHA